MSTWHLNHAVAQLAFLTWAKETSTLCQQKENFSLCSIRLLLLCCSPATLWDALPWHGAKTFTSRHKQAWLKCKAPRCAEHQRCPECAMVLWSAGGYNHTSHSHAGLGAQEALPTYPESSGLQAALQQSSSHLQQCVYLLQMPQLHDAAWLRAAPKPEQQEQQQLEVT